MNLINQALTNFCRYSVKCKSYHSLSLFVGELLQVNSMAKWSYYAVAKGRKVGLFTTWDDCKKQVNGFKGARFKGFHSKDDAEKFISSNGSIKAIVESKITGELMPLSNFKSDMSQNENQDKANLKRTLDNDTNVTSSESKKIKNDDLSSGRTVTDKGFSVNNHGFYEVYTDGACTKNGRSGARAGLGVFWSNVNGSLAKSLNLSEPVIGDRATNNVGEIQAITRCVQQAIDQGLDKLLVYSDSQFALNCVEEWMPRWKNNGWKKRDGQDVINRIELEDLDSCLLEAQKQNILVKFQHIRGHHGIIGNEEADRLAVAGALKCSI